MRKQTVRLLAGITIIIASMTGTKWGCAVTVLAVLLFVFPFGKEET